MPPTHREILTILGGLMLGMFLAALDQTIVATSIRTIGDDLHGLSLQAWVTTAYLLTATISTPLYGKLSDIYGRKPLYLISISIFVVGSLLSGTADSMYQLAVYRGVQGLGAGGLMALAITILGDLVAPRERARYQGYFLAVFGTASVLGPVVGGFFAGAETILGITGWRWVFLINVPIGILAIIVVARVLHLPPLKRVDHRIDYPGALALVVALVPLLVVAEQGRIWGWDSPRSLACYVDRRARRGRRSSWPSGTPRPTRILPLYLFRNRTFSVGAAANTVIGLGMFGGLATLPLYLQIVKGQSPTEAGLTLIPFTLGIMTGSIVAGQTTSRTGRYKAFPVIGTVLMGLGALFFSRLEARTPRCRTCSRVDPVRARPGLHDAAAGAGRAERRGGPGHGRRDVVVAVLPADGRHAGHRRVPVGAVLDGRRQHRGRVPDRVADAGVPGGGRRPGGRGRPGERARPGDAAGRRQRCRRWTTRRSSTPSTRGSRSRSSTASRSRWTPCCCWPRASWCSA